MIDGPALVVGPVFLCFELGGPPGHKGRHRSRMVFPRGKKPFIQQYPDPATAAYEATLKQAAAIFMRGRAPTEAPLALLVHSFRPIPPSWSGKARRAAIAGDIRPTSRPDWDNYGKITDALNKIVWLDDAQVVDGRVIKLYAEHPALRIEVREFVLASSVVPAVTA